MTTFEKNKSLQNLSLTARKVITIKFEELSRNVILIVYQFDRLSNWRRDENDQFRNRSYGKIYFKAHVHIIHDLFSYLPEWLLFFQNQTVNDWIVAEQIVDLILFESELKALLG